jgi:hypothetical protein
MSERPDFCTHPVVFPTPAGDAFTVRKNLEFSGGLFDVYSPLAEGPHPTVVLVAGYPDDGFARMLGCRFKEMRHTTSWASLLAASGLTAITYSNRDPLPDLRALLEIVDRPVALWATSGNVPAALGCLAKTFPVPIRCAAFLYGYMLDVAELAKSFHFADPATTFDELRWDVPLFIARADQDQTPRLNASIDRFVDEAARRSAPVTFMNHPLGPHVFDIVDDSDTSRFIVERAVAFLRRGTT